MRKFAALYTNEMIKISRKAVLVVVLAVMLLGIVVVGGFFKMMEISQRSYETDIGTSDGITPKGEMENILATLKDEQKSVQARFDAASTAEEKEKIRTELLQIESQIKLYQLAIDKDINLLNVGYLAQSLNEWSAADTSLAACLAIPEAERTAAQKKQILELESKKERYTRIIEEKDYALYIQTQNEAIDADLSLTEEEKTIQKESNALRLTADPTGAIGMSSYYDPLEYPLGTVESIKLSLIYNIDYTSYSSIRPLTPASRQELENRLAVEIRRIESGAYNEAAAAGGDFRTLSANAMTGFGMFMLVVLSLILAGGAVSQEISSGSIKSLIISPTKRYKIFFAKLASLLTVGAAAALLLYLFSVLVHGVFWGFSGNAAFIYAIHGKAYEMNYFIYRFLYLAVDFLDVIVYMVFAYMLSILTRNTAASVGISIAIYFGGSLVNSFLQIISTGEWAKFIPFNNMSLAGRIFPDSTASAAMNLLGFRAVVPSVGFSLIYLAVMLICFGYTALDSFNRRDIK